MSFSAKTLRPFESLDTEKWIKNDNSLAYFAQLNILDPLIYRENAVISFNDVLIMLPSDVSLVKCT